MEIIYVYIVFLASLFFLIRSSDKFVEQASLIGKKLGVSEFIIGITLVAVGTSLPELISSIMAAYSGNSEFAVGNVVGSNIANIGLVLGLSAIFMPLLANKEIFQRDGILMVAASFLFFYFAFDGTITNIEGLIMLFLFVAYIIYLYASKAEFQRKFHFGQILTFFETKDKIKYRPFSRVWKKTAKSVTTHKKITDDLSYSTYEAMIGRVYFAIKQSIFGDLSVLAFFGILICFSARYLVESSVSIAEFFDLSSHIISLTLVALGTSLPELSVSFSAIRKGLKNILLGNIIGSNIANLLVVVGVAAIVAPLNVIKTTIHYTIPFMILMTLILFLFIKTDWEIKRYEGALLFMLYILFLVVVVFSVFFL